MLRFCSCLTWKHVFLGNELTAGICFEEKSGKNLEKKSKKLFATT